MTTHHTASDHAADPLAATAGLGRRRLLRTLGLLGVGVPVAGLLGTACTQESTGASPRKTAEPLVARSGGGAAGAAAPAQAVDLPYMHVPQIAPALTRTTTETVKVHLTVKDVKAKLADGAGYQFWTFNGTVPGPMIRVRQGDTVELTLENPKDSALGHNIDLHAVTGPGGGAELTRVSIGETKAFSFKAINPGVYIYHCATAPIDLHISNGMYGLIVVEPPELLPKVDREFYVCQGEVYTKNPTGTPGMQEFDLSKMADERPTYVTFNGAMGAVTGDRALKAK